MHVHLVKCIVREAENGPDIACVRLLGESCKDARRTEPAQSINQPRESCFKKLGSMRPLINNQLREILCECQVFPLD